MALLGLPRDQLTPPGKRKVNPCKYILEGSV